MNKLFTHRQFFFQFLIIIFGSGLTFSQSIYDKLKLDSEKAFLRGDYEEALNYYRISSDKNSDIVYNKAICYFKLNRFDSSLLYFQKCLSIKKYKNEAIFYTARSLHHLEHYQKAAEFYRLFLKVSKQKSLFRTEAKRLLMQAFNVNKTLRSDDFALLLPLEKSGNSDFDDFFPIENHRTPGLLYFNSNRRGHNEIFFEKVTEHENNLAVMLDARYNPIQNQQIVAFPDSGYQIMYLMDGKITLDNFKDGFEQSLAVPLKGLDKIMMADAHLVNDSLLLFSANIPGGYGALDLYAAMKDNKGNWNNIKNLGPEVNSIFDERAAFLEDSTTVMYFSSNRPQAIGGFDVFKFDFQKKISAIPFNFPVNSSGDDLFFRPDACSKEAWLSSVRMNGLGGFDNYRLIFREPLCNVNDINICDLLFGKNNNDIPKKNEQLVNIDTFFFSDLNFESEGKIEVLSEKLLNEMSNFMLKNPDVKIVISAHTDNLQDKNHSLLFTLSQCEKVAAIIQRRGIAADRIYLRGLADQYPLAKNKNIDNSADKTGMMINRRIEFNFIDTDSLKTFLIKKEKMISSVLKVNGAEKLQEQLSGLSFKIELASGDHKQNFDFLSTMKDVSLEKKALSSKVSFCVGISKKFDAIAILLETVIASGFENAIIQAYWDGFPMNRTMLEVKSIHEKELQKYKDYLNAGK